MLPKSYGKDVEQGDLNVELGLLCTDDFDELNEMYGPLCWQGCENDHGHFKKLMWNGIIKDFNFKVISYVVQLQARERNGLDAPTIWGKRESKNSTA